MHKRLNEQRIIKTKSKGSWCRYKKDVKSKWDTGMKSLSKIAAISIIRYMNITTYSDHTIHNIYWETMAYSALTFWFIEMCCLFLLFCCIDVHINQRHCQFLLQPINWIPTINWFSLLLCAKFAISTDCQTNNGKMLDCLSV